VDTARIVLRRRGWPISDLFRTYKVILDGRVVGWIKRRKTLTFEVAPGHHELHLEIDWCSSRNLELDLAAGQEVRLLCGGRGPSLYGITGGRRDYIALDVEAPTTAA
jgi:hypothetical protein